MSAPRNRRDASRAECHENISRYICERLIFDGHDVVRCQDVAAGKPDTEVLAFATANNLIVLTEDTDFGELVVRQSLPTAAVVLSRLSGMDRTAQPNYYLAQVLKAYPNNPTARKAIKPQAKWRNAR